MNPNLIQNAEKFNTRNRHKSAWQKVVSFLGCVVVFCTTYALILPAITQERESFCGYDAHTHNDSCYIQVSEPQRDELICSYESLGLHVHLETCYDSNNLLICEQDDFVIHTHNNDCVDENGNVICALPEVQSHIHDDTCYGTVGAHAHSDACYTLQRDQLICQNTEIEAHKHSESCYTVNDTLLCTTAVQHTHNDACYEVGQTICGTPENHVHGAECTTDVLQCQNTTGIEHFHDAQCYVQQITCTTPENHLHIADCYEHTLTCTTPENHNHETGCYEATLTCEQEETDGYQHTDACYTFNNVLSCNLEESPGEIGLICTPNYEAGHIHDDSCFTWIEPTTLTCKIPEDESHSHSERCYGIWENICEAEEHTHSLACYSNPNADVETASSWEGVLSTVELSGIWADDVIAVAKTQLGYRESTANYIVEDDGETVKGYTRYGAWYGAPYGDWCAMFISFCLNYADVEGIPFDAGCRPWIEALTARDLYRTAEYYNGRPGDIIFFDVDDDELSDHVGIVYEIIEATAEEPEKITVIEGNSSNTVRVVTYDRADSTILGYGLIPENTELSYICDTAWHIHSDACYDEEDNLVCTAPEHAHVEDCLESSAYFCGIEGHAHEDGCFDADGNLICTVQEHTHEDLCMERDRRSCNLIAHIHEAACYDTEAQAVCGKINHNHSIACDVDLSGLSEEELQKLEICVLLIDALPTMEEIDEQILAFDEFEDFESEEYLIAEEALSNLFQEVALAYDHYSKLSETAQERVVNRDKILGLEYIWSSVTLKVGDNRNLWFDGSNGGILSLSGVTNKKVNAKEGDTIILDTNLYGTITPYANYAYTLRGWYDIVNKEYYAVGDEYTVTKDTVFYADWTPATYDVGEFNPQTANTVSTNDFITTHVFDYTTLINTKYMQANVTVNGDKHSETWALKQSTLENGGYPLIFVDHDYGMNSPITMPSTRGTGNNEGSDTKYTQGLFVAEIRDWLFSPESETVGKYYLGTGDHLFQYASDPSDPNYGYYYYNSALNAASYNRSKQRFYVYDYLARAHDSAEWEKGTYSDFLPFNSPYANTNGKTVATYAYKGEHNEYNGTSHYDYWSGRNDSSLKINSVTANYWFGLASEVDFYLPAKPGTTDEDGRYANRSASGEDMIFYFSGDDDMWVLVDDTMVLDIGGVRDVQEGEINFSTGEVKINGTVNTAHSNAVKNLSYGNDGDHKLKVYYLERGSSMSNCSIKFNLAPRYSLTIQKEDVLTRELLNGAEFEVYTDMNCTTLARLWTSKESYDNDDSPAESFIVDKGKASMWGFAAGNTYYIKEVTSPDGYGGANGIIAMTLDSTGLAVYDIIEDPNLDEKVSSGFTVHGFRIDNETHEAYMVVTNGNYGEETTSIYVQKQWADSADHSDLPITAYLWANGIKIREVTLSENNNWNHTWTNLPVYNNTEQTDTVDYAVTESVVPGYIGTISPTTEKVTTVSTWTEVSAFSDGTFVLKNANGYLSANSSGFYWEPNETKARSSQESRWKTVHSQSDRYFLTNEAGYTLQYSNSQFVASSNQNNSIAVHFTSNNLRYRQNSRNTYSFNGINNNGTGASTRNTGITLELFKESQSTTTSTLDYPGFLITNTPTSQVMSLRVNKQWDLGNLATEEMYETYTIPVTLLKNGSDTGLTVELSLKNDWTAAFTNLPVYDENQALISYTVREDLEIPGWYAKYSPVVSINGDNTSYETTITNVYHVTYALPETGGFGASPYIIGGLLLTAIALLGLRRTHPPNSRKEDLFSP